MGGLFEGLPTQHTKFQFGKMTQIRQQIELEFRHGQGQIPFELQ